MNKFTYIIFIPLLILACDKTDISNRQEESFIKVYGSINSKDFGNDVIPLTNGGYALTGTITTSTASPREQICLIITDEYGNRTVEDKYYGGPFNDAGKKIVELPQGGFIILAEYQLSLDGDKDILLLRADANGDTLWTKRLFFDGDSKATDMILVDDNAVVFTGSSIGENNNYDPVWQKINIEGEEEWLIINLYDFGGDDIANAIIQKDNGFVITGSTRNLLTGSSNIFILQTTDIGTLQTGRTLTDIVQEGNKISSDIVFLDNSYYITGSIYNPESNSNDILYARLNTSFNVQNWEQIGTAYNDMGKSIILSGGIIHMLCAITPSENISLIKIYQINNSTDSRNEFEFGGSGQVVGESFNITSDNGYIIIGTNTQDAQSEISLIKVKENGSF